MKTTKKRIIYTVIVTLIIVFSTTYAILMTLERMDYRNYLQGEYSKNMHELITAVDNIRSDLTKVAIVGSKEQSIIVFEEIFRYSAMANDKLNSLPISTEVSGDTSKFLSQIGDFSNTLIRNISEGKELTKENYETIETLKLQSLDLQNDLNAILSEINEGEVNWGEIRKKAAGVLVKNEEANISDKFKDIQKQVAQYPALIYDGPFSDNVVDIKPKIISEKEVSKEYAMKVAKKAVGEDRVESIKEDKGSNQTVIPSYRFNIGIKGRNNKNDLIICEVSKNGGKIVYLLDNRNIENSKIDMSKATKIGNKYLESLGYKDMVATYKLKYDNTAIISYVYNQDDIMIYPDQIKLKVALDDGSIIGIESQKYLISHVEKRNIQKPKINKETAQKRVGKNLDIKSVKLAIVPTVTNKEILCYEFSGSYKGDNFIVYINAQTGYEQRILQIINTPNGRLTM